MESALASTPAATPPTVRPHMATAEEMARFHSDEYVDFLRRVTPDTMNHYVNQLTRFGIGEFTDCPVFEGLFDFCAAYTGGSVDGAPKLDHGLSGGCVDPCPIHI